MPTTRAVTQDKHPRRHHTRNPIVGIFALREVQLAAALIHGGRHRVDDAGAEWQRTAAQVRLDLEVSEQVRIPCNRARECIGRVAKGGGEGLNPIKAEMPKKDREENWRSRKRATKGTRLGKTQELDSRRRSGNEHKALLSRVQKNDKKTPRLGRRHDTTTNL